MEKTVLPKQVLEASAFTWDDGKLSGNWASGLGHIHGLSESNVRATISVWIRMLRRYGTQDVDSLLKILLEQDSDAS